MATAVAGDAVFLKPVFIGALRSVVSPAWAVPIWKVPPGTDLNIGSFLFTSQGELAGLVVNEGGESAVVPGETVLDHAERLLEHPVRVQGYVGVEVQSLSPALETAVAAGGGVLVTWVDAEGPATKELIVGDILEVAQGQRIASQRQWDVLTARLQPTDVISIRVRRRDSVRDVQLMATSFPTVLPAPRLGLTLRRVPGAGVEVMRVDRLSAAERAGLLAGDLITLIGDRRNPSPTQVTQAFASLPAGRPLRVVITRGDAHRMLALER
jgi:S1-C subfamily serine protease